MNVAAESLLVFGIVDKAVMIFMEFLRFFLKHPRFFIGEIPFEKMDVVIQQAVKECEEKGITGKRITPFLLGRVKDLTEDDVSKLREYIEKNLRVEGELRSDVNLSVKRLIEISCFRGVRHRKGLPVRGQSSKRNARTRKGPRRTVAKKKTASK